METAALKHVGLWQKLLWSAAALGLWELTAGSGRVSPLLLPSPRAVLNALLRGAGEGTLLLQLGQSLSLVVVGLAVGLVLAVIMAWGDYAVPGLRHLLSLMAAALHPLPGVALLPVVVIWAGVGLRAVFLIIIHAVLWSLFLNIRSGFRTVDRALVETARNEGATDFQVFRLVLLPCSTEALTTGLQVGWSRGWRALIGAEMVFGAISSLGGIGWYIFERRAFMDTPGIYAGILVVALTGAVVEQLVFRHSEQ